MKGQLKGKFYQNRTGILTSKTKMKLSDFFPNLCLNISKTASLKFNTYPCQCTLQEI